MNDCRNGGKLTCERYAADALTDADLEAVIAGKGGALVAGGAGPQWSNPGWSYRTSGGWAFRGWGFW